MNLMNMSRSSGCRMAKEYILPKSWQKNNEAFSAHKYGCFSFHRLGF